MEQENMGQVDVNQRSSSPGETAAQAESGYDITVRQVSSTTAVQSHYYGRPEPVALVIRDLLDLPRQILPEQTYVHLKNAGKEALLAVVSLLDSLNEGSGGGKHVLERSEGTRRHIDVE
jgi:hypothetical protein